MKAFGWTTVAIIGATLLVNALFMLASPKAWFRLPYWARAQGSLTERKYSSGSGAVQVRLTGAVVLALIIWVLYNSLLR